MTTTNIELISPSSFSTKTVSLRIFMSLFSPSVRLGVSIKMKLLLVPFQQTFFYKVCFLHDYLEVETSNIPLTSHTDWHNELLPSPISPTTRTFRKFSLHSLNYLS